MRRRRGDREKISGIVFAPYMIERFTKVEGNMLKPYYTMSTWNPYTVVKMESDFTVTRREDNGGDDGTRIRRRQRRASCTYGLSLLAIALHKQKEGNKMITTRTLASMLVGGLFLIASVAIAASAEQLDSSWLNGKWEGQPPAGGVLTMTLSVGNDNQIRGSGIIPVRGGREAHPDVTGTVKGKQVVLETFFSEARVQSKVHYNCRFADNALQCRTPSGYTTTFKKVD